MKPMLTTLAVVTALAVASASPRALSVSSTPLPTPAPDANSPLQFVQPYTFANNTVLTCASITKIGTLRPQTSVIVKPHSLDNFYQPDMNCVWRFTSRTRNALRLEMEQGFYMGDSVDTLAVSYFDRYSGAYTSDSFTHVSNLDFASSNISGRLDAGNNWLNLHFTSDALLESLAFRLRISNVAPVASPTPSPSASPSGTPSWSPGISPSTTSSASALVPLGVSPYYAADNELFECELLANTVTLRPGRTVVLRGYKNIAETQRLNCGLRVHSEERDVLRVTVTSFRIPVEDGSATFQYYTRDGNQLTTQVFSSTGTAPLTPVFMSPGSPPGQLDAGGNFVDIDVDTTFISTSTVDVDFRLEVTNMGPPASPTPSPTVTASASITPSNSPTPPASPSFSATSSNVPTRVPFASPLASLPGLVASDGSILDCDSPTAQRLLPGTSVRVRARAAASGYDALRNCHWQLFSDEFSVLRMQVEELALEPDGDNIAVEYRRMDTNALRSTTLQGTTIPYFNSPGSGQGHLATGGNVIDVTFASDSRNTGPGFQLHVWNAFVPPSPTPSFTPGWSAPPSPSVTAAVTPSNTYVPPTPLAGIPAGATALGNGATMTCSNSLAFGMGRLEQGETATLRIQTSSFYSNNMHCYWRVYAPERDSLTLRVLALDTELNEDELVITFHDRASGAVHSTTVSGGLAHFPDWSSFSADADVLPIGGNYVDLEFTSSPTFVQTGFRIQVANVGPPPSPSPAASSSPAAPSVSGTPLPAGASASVSPPPPAASPAGTPAGTPAATSSPAAAQSASTTPTNSPNGGGGGGGGGGSSSPSPLAPGTGAGGGGAGQERSGDDAGSSAGALAGGVVGGIAGAALLGALAYYVWTQRAVLAAGSAVAKGAAAAGSAGEFVIKSPLDAARAADGARV